MDRKFEHLSILQERVLTPEAVLWLDRIRGITSRIGVRGYLKGGLLRDYISNLYNGTILDPKDLDIMLLGNVNLAVSELVKEGAIIRLRRKRRKTPVFELALPVNKGIINADIGIVLGEPNSYVRDQKIGPLIEDDARSSDFTVNTLFLPLDKQLDVTNLIDPLGGTGDIKARLVRMVTPDTFVRHPDCMLRAVKIADKLSATIESETYQAIQRYSSLIKKARQPLIQENLESILESPNREQNIKILRELKLLNYLTGA